MADISRREKIAQWVGVVVIIVGFIISGLGLIMMSWFVGIAGIVTIGVGGAIALASGVMENVH